jgi:spore germination cell wall hydrolase CwlJ-like protein
MVGYSLMVACLALNIYHEAGVEPPKGQLAVGLVTLNRAKQHHTDICDVVFDDSQFSWTKDARDEHGKLKKKYLPHGVLWLRSQRVAHQVLNGVPDFTHGATYYYADYIAAPNWDFTKLQYVGKFGSHFFYRDSGL